MEGGLGRASAMVGLFFLATLAGVHAAPPSNDDIVDRMIIVGDHTSFFIDLNDATLEPMEASTFCVDEGFVADDVAVPIPAPIEPATASRVKSAWFEYRPAADGWLTVSADRLLHYADFGDNLYSGVTAYAPYSGTGSLIDPSATAPGVPTGCDGWKSVSNGFDRTGQFRMVAPAVQDEPVIIQVLTTGQQHSNRFEMEFAFEELGPPEILDPPQDDGPANDDFADAAPLRFGVLGRDRDLAEATIEPGEATYNCIEGVPVPIEATPQESDRTVWHRFTAGQAGELTLHYRFNFLKGGITLPFDLAALDYSVTAFRAAPVAEPSLHSLIPVTCGGFSDLDSPYYYDVQLTIGVAPAETVYFQVWAKDLSSGQYAAFFDPA